MFSGPAKLVPHWPLSISPPSLEQKKEPVTERARPGRLAGNPSRAKTRGLQSPAQAPEVEEAGRAGPWVQRAAGSQTPPPQELAETTLAVLCPPASHSAIQFPSIIGHRSTHKRVGPSKDFPCQILKSELGIKEDRAPSSWFFICHFGC